MLWFGGALQARLWAPEVPQELLGPFAAQVFLTFWQSLLAGGVFAGCVCLGNSVLLCSACSGRSTQSTDSFKMRN